MAADFDEQNPDRMTPRACVGAARDALDRAYAWHGQPPYPMLMEAIDWQRRALEQLAAADQSRETP